MNDKRRIDKVRKRNSDLVKELEDLKLKIEFDKQTNLENYQSVKDLITELDNTKNEWKKLLNELQDDQRKYSYLMDKVRRLYRELRHSGSVPWYKTIFRK